MAVVYLQVGGWVVVAAKAVLTRRMCVGRGLQNPRSETRCEMGIIGEVESPQTPTARSFMSMSRSCQGTSSDSET